MQISAVNHSVSEQSLTIKEALRMCTYNGAYATFDEKERGSLEVGKIADFAILSDNLYEIEPAKISDVTVVDLYLQGKRMV